MSSQRGKQRLRKAQEVFDAGEGTTVDAHTEFEVSQGQYGLIVQLRKEGIEFVLYAGLEAGEHGGNEDGKWQAALPLKRGVVESDSLEQVRRMQVGGKVGEDGQDLRSAW
ncbi:MAG: hypothetical protein EPN21_20225 [Methylococcaceae bacterium]|nr:MAG: hypothetical protein EPN21_20225 [Methylococcaceae bacterium]